MEFAACFPEDTRKALMQIATKTDEGDLRQL